MGSEWQVMSWHTQRPGRRKSGGRWHRDCKAKGSEKSISQFNNPQVIASIALVVPSKKKKKNSIQNKGIGNICLNKFMHMYLLQNFLEPLL